MQSASKNVVPSRRLTVHPSASGGQDGHSGLIRTLVPLLLVATIPLAVFPADQDPKPAASPEPTVNIMPRGRARTPEAETITERSVDIRVDTTLVLIPVGVTDLMSRFVTGLERENFKVYEEKIEQQITQFSSEDAPLSIGVVFDTSGSMGSKLTRSRQAVTQFMKTANPQDEFFLIVFNDRPELVQSFTKQTEEIQNRLTFVQARGRTALLDSVYMAMSQMKKAHNPRKAILIISDGGDQLEPLHGDRSEECSARS